MGARRKSSHPVGLLEREGDGGGGVGSSRGCCSPHICSQSQALGWLQEQQLQKSPAAGVGTLPAGPVPLPVTVAVVFGKDEGELPPPSPPLPSPTHRWDPQPSLVFSAELSRNSPRRSVTRERDNPSLNKLFSFPRIKGRKRRGVVGVLDQD